MTYNKVAPSDLQKVWHKYVGKLFVNKTILDVGAGAGKSKERLSYNANRVTTSDVNRALMNTVDIIQYPEKIVGKWDVVTAFDVIEHVVDREKFLYAIQRLSNSFVFVTTPNWNVYPTGWHFTEHQFAKMMGIPFYNLKYFVRRNGSDYCDILQVTEGQFLKRNQNNNHFGILGCINAAVENCDDR